MVSFQTVASFPDEWTGSIFWTGGLVHEAPRRDYTKTVERYVKEVNRVTSVLEGHLAKQRIAFGGGETWLVGNKISFADISFLSWHTIIGLLLPSDEYNVNNYPHVEQWLENMGSRRSVKSAGIIVSVTRFLDQDQLYSHCPLQYYLLYPFHK